MALRPPQNFIRDCTITAQNLLKANDFARENELWKGIMNYKWLSKMLFLFAVLASILLISTVMDWWQQIPSQMNSLADFSGAVSSLFQGGYNLFAIGGLKYVVLILVEVVIFHFARRTLEIIKQEDVDNSFDAFLRAQKRMFAVAIFSFIMESFFSLLFKIGTGIIGISWINPTGVFLIQCFFLGFAIIDNYNEIFHLKVKHSFRLTKRYFGVALVIGIPVYLIMMMPLLGTFIGPVLGAIAATLTMHHVLEVDGGLEWVFVERTKRK